MGTNEPVTFVPFTTFIDPTFWSVVNKRKVDDWQLESAPVPIKASFSSCIFF